MPGVFAAEPCKLFKSYCESLMQLVRWVTDWGTAESWGMESLLVTIFLVNIKLYLSLLGTKGFERSKNLAGSSSWFFKVGGRSSTWLLIYSWGSNLWLRILSGYLSEAIILSICAFFYSWLISFWYLFISNFMDFLTFSLKFSSFTKSTSLL